MLMDVSEIILFEDNTKIIIIKNVKIVTYVQRSVILHRLVRALYRIYIYNPNVKTVQMLLSIFI